jgi:hypothetical protein
MSANVGELGAQMVFDAINAANPSLQNGPVSASNVTLGTPTATGATPNTSVEMTGIAGQGYSGSDTITYDRIDIGAMFTTWGDNPATVPNGATYTNASDMLPTINATYGTDLQAADIVDGAIGASSYPFAYSLVMAAGCLAYTGELAINITA